MKRYFAKKDTWFKEGTEAFRLEEWCPAGILFNQDGTPSGASARYNGTYIVGSCNPEGYDKYWYEHGYKDGDEVNMNEICDDDEFEIIEDNNEN